MALIKAHTFKGVPIADAYHRVNKLEYYKLPQAYEGDILVPENPYVLNIQVEVCAYPGGQTIDWKGYNMPLQIDVQGAYITQVYEWLKRLPEYVGAVDA